MFRFAPSPTGRLHLGHAYSALYGFRAAQQSGGRFLLRIEDIDSGRCRAEFEQAIHEDLEWLGLRWEEPVRRQSQHGDDYAAALARLGAQGLTYPCFCTRREIQEEIARSPSAPHGPEGPLYPGTCRRMSPALRQERLARGEACAIRLDSAAAARRVGALTWHERSQGEIAVEPAALGDAVIARKDIGTSYHVAVVVDDALQGVTDVTRGLDLRHATHLHRVLQAALALPAPAYDHHRLVSGEDGARLAKRSGSATLAGLREAGVTAEAVRRRLGFA